MVMAVTGPTVKVIDGSYNDKWMIINPNNIQNVVKFNLLDDDVVGKYVGCVNETRVFMTSKGDVVGPFKTCYADKDHPIMKLTVEAKGENFDLATHLLVQGGNGYSYWFFAGGKWKRCSDAADALLGEGVIFDSAYGNYFPWKVGPGAILKALRALQTGNQSAWRQPFLLLVFTFLEATRLEEVMELVKNNMDKAAGTDGFLYFQDKVTVLAHNCVGEWGKMSDALKELFNPKPKQLPKWTLPISAVVALGLDRVPEGKEGDVEVVRRVNIKQILQCFRLIHVLTRDE